MTAQPDLWINRDDGIRYWSSIPATVDGMLGGTPQFAPHISRADLQGSRAFLAKLGLGQRRGRARVSRVLEGGAGIGRVTLGLLTDVAAVVDVIEPIAAFTAHLDGKPGVGHVMNIGMEDWVPEMPLADQEGGEETSIVYDLVWNQLCVGQLTDEQLVTYLARCRQALSPGGYVCIKDNTSRTGNDIFDPTDSSVTRGDPKFRAIFQAAGLRVARTELQKGLPGGLYPIRMYALAPVEPENSMRLES